MRYLTDHPPPPAREVPEQPDDIELEIAGEAIADGETADGVLAPDALSTVELMSAGESKKVEFKSSATFDWETGKKNKELEFAIAKTIAGFANSHGGTLLIGVNDRGKAVGLGDDYRLANQKRQDADGYENWLTSMLAENLGKVATTHLSMSFTEVEGHEVCRVDVIPSKVPIFIRSQKSSGDFYVRLTNSTRLLNTAEAMEYIRSHWS